ncbi:MAG: YlxR family protein [Propionibacteriaceae bacterium]|nr:YlxR family protein [Propionibacteriaceae bacterium]
MRTCVGCRATAEKSELVRVVAIDGQAHIDAAARLPGRGAYLHARASCLSAAIRRRALSRALRQPVGTDRLSEAGWS